MADPPPVTKHKGTENGPSKENAIRCPICPAARVRTRHGRGRHDAGTTPCHQCRAYVCGRHARWDDVAGDWLCTRCARAAKAA